MVVGEVLHQPRENLCFGSGSSWMENRVGVPYSFVLVLARTLEALEVLDCKCTSYC